MLDKTYQEFYNSVIKVVPKKRIYTDALNTLAFGTDASFYRLTPKIVIKAYNEDEVVTIIKTANRLDIPVTFRAAGTSLSGQGITDSVLVITSHGWEGYEVLDNGNKIKLQPGIRGFRANTYLAKYAKKIGPDPAAIDSAMIGGIIANNASGMYCGTHENAYRTIEDVRLVLSDGTILDTADKASVDSFRKTHKELINRLEAISKRIADNKDLHDKISKKYQIKNTTGFGLNSFIDFNDGVDIFKHLIVGSEGTIAFISNVTLRTVENHPHKALALIIYPNIEIACKAVQKLATLPAFAVELLDRVAIKSVEDSEGVPAFIKTISDESCMLLVETKGATKDELNKNTSAIAEGIKEFKAELPYIFTDDPKEQAVLWKARKEIFPTIAGMRASGTTPLIEDICFHIDDLAAATLDLHKVFAEHGYQDAAIYGHALAGNLHFVFNQNFSDCCELERYRKFMDAIAKLVVEKYNGSLKAEHGTGRNMAPFVRKEWGEDAYAIMEEIKDIFDPKGIINPGVMVNKDEEIHLKNLKPLPAARSIIDKCLECGFCEAGCVSEGLTLSPRQRVSIFRNIEDLKASGQEPHLAAELCKSFQYNGLDTCATDSLCSLRCPVKVDTGKMVKIIRNEQNSKSGERTAMWIATHMAGITSFGRGALNFLYVIRNILGKKTFGALAKFFRTISFNKIPFWNEHSPKGAKKIDTVHPNLISDKKMVYFPSCITRSMGVSKSYCKEVEVTEITKKLITKAGYQIIYPDNLNSLCCGMSFSSKGFVEAGKKASDTLQAALLKASENGKYPILCDMSPCLYTMRTNMEGVLKLYEPAEFAQEYLMPYLDIKPLDTKVSVFAVCSAKKLSVDTTLYNLAKQCAKEVTVIDSNCCGFAGDRGFSFPELNAHGLRNLKAQASGSESGYATSRTCEIGLSYHSGIEFKSIYYLIDKCSSPKNV